MAGEDVRVNDASCSITLCAHTSARSSVPVAKSRPSRRAAPCARRSANGSEMRYVCASAGTSAANAMRFPSRGMIPVPSPSAAGLGE